MTTVLRRVTRAGLVLSGAALLLRPEGRPRKLLRAAGDRLAREARNWSGQWEGVSYRLAGRRPDPGVSDNVLADRIRSTIGPLEHRLDVPRVHVMVEDHVALLHGDVGRVDEARRIEETVAAVPGVEAVESYLHVGLLPGDTRPSEGRAGPAESEARKRLLAAAVRAGVAESDAPTAVRVVLSRFAERLPAGERRHLLSHLPGDVRTMLDAPRRLGRPPRLRSLPDLVFLTLVSTNVIPPGAGRSVVTAVVGELQALVPEEAADVAAVLPSDLRRFWQAAPRRPRTRR